MAREVLAMEANRSAPKFPSKVAQVSQSRSQFRNVQEYQRKTASKSQSRPQRSHALLFLSRTVSKCPRKTAAMFPGRAVLVCLSRNLSRWLRRSAVGVVEVMVAVDTMVNMPICFPFLNF